MKKKGQQPGRLVRRSLIILWADADKTIAQSAALLDCCEQTVLNQRSGRPLTYDPIAKAQVVASVCEILHEQQQPLSRFALSDLCQLIRPRTGLSHLSQASLSRVLAQNALKPWQFRSWLFPQAPDFVAKACVVLDLSAGFWQGQRLGPEQ
jgi:hypothetical protein